MTARLIRNTASTTLAEFGQIATAFLFMPLLVSRFGLREYGAYLLASSLAGYLALLDFGIGTALTKQVAERRAGNGESNLSDLATVGFGLYATVGVAACLILLTIARFTGDIFSLSGEQANLASTLFVVAAVASLVIWPLMTANAVLAGLERYDLTAAVSLFTTVLGAVVTIAVVALRAGPVALTVGMSGATVCGGILAVVFVRLHAKGTKLRRRHFRRSTAHDLVSFSWMVFVIQICGFVVYQQTDRIVLGVFVGAAAIALYEAPAKLMNLVRRLAVLTGVTAIPTASALATLGHADHFRRLFLDGTKFGDAVVLPVVVVIASLAHPILYVWLGPVYVGQTLAVQVFLSYWLVTANVALAVSVLTGSGRVSFLLWYSLATATVNLSISIVLAQRIGIMGVILGSVIANVGGFPFFLAYVLRTIQVDFATWLRRIVVPTYPALSIPLLICTVCTHLYRLESFMAIAAVSGVALMAYWSTFWFAGLGKEERWRLVEAMRLAAGRRPGRAV